MKPIYGHILFLVCGFLAVLLGIIQIKREDTDTVLTYFGALDIIFGIMILVLAIATWNCF